MIVQVFSLLTHESFNQKFQVYSGHYVDPTRKGKQVNDNLAIRNDEWPWNGKCRRHCKQT